MSVQVMVYVYLIVCVSMIIFNLVYVAVYKRGDKMSRRMDRPFCDEIKNAVLKLEQDEDVSDEHMRLLKSKCRNIWKMAALDETLSELSSEHKDAVDSYVEQTKDLYSYLSLALKNAEPTQQAHFAYMVEKYNIVASSANANILTFMLELVQSGNIYCRQNALRVLYQAGDIDSVVSALKFLSSGHHYHNEKLVTDGLLSFKGDREALIESLWESFELFNIPIKLVVLNFIRYGSEKHCDRMLAIMLDISRDDELRFAAMRYFARYSYQPAEAFLKDVASHSDSHRWEYAAIAASALAKYPGEETVHILKECLSNVKWYIRYNAAESLEKLRISYRELSDIMDGRDRYAREVLQYRMDMHEMRELSMKGGE